MSGRASLDLQDEVLSGVITMEYVSGTRLGWVQWSAVVCFGSESERDFVPWRPPSDMFVVHD